MFGGVIVLNGDLIMRLYVDVGGVLLIVGWVSGNFEIYVLCEYLVDGVEAISRVRTYARNLNKSDVENVDEECVFFVGEFCDFVDMDFVVVCMILVYIFIGRFSSVGKVISCVRTNVAVIFFVVGDVVGCVFLFNF